MPNWLTDLLGLKPNDGKVASGPPIAQPTTELGGLDYQYDLILGALCIWREARGEPREGQVAVWHVILNRLTAGWGKSVADIVLAPKQFSCFNRDDPQVNLYPKHGDPQWLQCLEVVTGNDPNPIGEAKNYFNPDNADPHWALRLVEVARIGRHVFYRDP